MKVLILSCNTGGGHNSCAKAIGAELLNRGHTYETDDALLYVSKGTSRFVSNWHVRFYRYFPKLYNKGYQYAEEHPASFDESSAACRMLRRGCKRLRAAILAGGYDAVTIKCWGDLAEQYGIAGCGAASWLNGHDRIVACEGDVNGALSLMIARGLSGRPGFLTDIVSVDGTANTALLWHIGCAGTCLAAPGQPRKLFSHFAAGKGVTAGFTLAPGPVTLLRLGDDGHGAFRLLAAAGECMPMELTIRGTIAQVRFVASAQGFLAELLDKGWEHHLVMAYGDLRADLGLLARTLNLPLTAL